MEVADSFAADVYTYRSLAAMDAEGTLDRLSKSVDLAEKTANDKSVSGLIDGLLSVGSAISEISDKVDAYKKTRQ